MNTENFERQAARLTAEEIDNLYTEWILFSISKVYTPTKYTKFCEFLNMKWAAVYNIQGGEDGAPESVIFANNYISSLLEKFKGSAPQIKPQC